jgi:hypothetical protein
MSHAGEDCIRCNTVTWGSPYRIVVTARPDRPFLVFWAGAGMGRDRPPPPDWRPIPCATRREAQLAIVLELLKWVAHPDQAGLATRIRERLRGRDLGCGCDAKTPCHVDVLLFVANQGQGPDSFDLPTYPEIGSAAMSTPPTRRPGLTIMLKGLKVNALVAPQSLTADLVPPEGQPAGDVPIDIEVGGRPAVRGRVNGKAIRKALKVIGEHGADNVVVLLQGQLTPGAEPGAWILDGAGLSCTPKTPPPPK